MAATRPGAPMAGGRARRGRGGGLRGGRAAPARGRPDPRRQPAAAGPARRPRTICAVAADVAGRTGLSDTGPRLHRRLRRGQHRGRRRRRGDRRRPARPGRGGRRLPRRRRARSPLRRRPGAVPATGRSARSAPAGRACCSGTGSPRWSWRPAGGARGVAPAGPAGRLGPGRRRLPRLPAPPGRHRAGPRDPGGAAPRRRTGRRRSATSTPTAPGTRLSDAAEAAALRRAFGDAPAQVPVSSTKSVHGHALEASALLELVVTVLALRRRPAAGERRLPRPRRRLPARPRARHPARSARGTR